MRASILSAVLSIGIIVAHAAPVSAQTPPQVFSSTNAISSSDVVFTNSAGQTFSADQFAESLKNLRTAIEQTTPMLAAVTETYTNSAGNDKSWKGQLSGLVSGALSRYEQQNAGKNSRTVNQVVGALQGLLQTNSSSKTTAADSTDANTVQKLVTLQNQLKPVLPTLDQLNVSSTGAAVSSPNPLTPTGR